MRRSVLPCSALALLLACGDAAPEPEAPAAAEPAQAPPAAEPTAATGPTAAPPAPDDLPAGLLLAVSRFETTPEGEPLPKSELVVLTRRGGAWRATSHEDEASNVFHKAMAYTPPGGEPGILTLGGSAAAVKLWRPRDGALVEVANLWEEDFGGRFSRMRDGEQGDLYGDGTPALAVATHDQGVVATIRPTAAGDWRVERLDEQPDTFIHEVELGDLDGDGVVEIYTTPSAPNKLDGKPQPGEVVRYVPAAGAGRTLVADLGDRHAKEILVEDVDGDGTDELYVSVEAVSGGRLEIRRYDADTGPGDGAVIATLDDTMCRFLTAGDVDGDGRLEMVAAAKDTGLWLLRPADDPRGPWSVERIDADSKGFEHAALLTDLDADGRDELYVASDRDRQLRRYVWLGDGFGREVIYERPDRQGIFTWNLMPVPLALVP